MSTTSFSIKVILSRSGVGLHSVKTGQGAGAGAGVGVGLSCD